MDIMSLTLKTVEAVKTVKKLYGSDRERIRTQTRAKVLEPHHKEKKTSSLLASAIHLSEKTDSIIKQYVLIASSV
jgi:hypothetical protein